MWEEAESSVKATSLKNEERLSEEIGFALTPGSGNRDWPGMKGDGAHPRFMFELKETKYARISVGGKDIGKLCREAAAVGKDPALVLSAYALPDPLPKDWVAVPASVFRYLLAKVGEQNG
jgi:hypothetical protein